MTPSPWSPVRRLALWLDPGLWLVLAGCVLLLASSRWHLPDLSPVPLSAAAAWVAYRGPRRLADAVALAVPPLVGPWVDGAVGSTTMLVACLVPFVLTRRAAFSAVAGSTVVALLLAGMRLKERFAGTTLTWQDIRFFFLRLSDNVAVMASQPTLLSYAAVALGLAALACTLAWRWGPPGGAQSRSSARTTGALALLMIMLGGAFVARQAVQLGDAGDAWIIGEGQLARPVLTFLSTVSLQPRWEVDAVDTGAFGRDSQRLRSGAALTRPADLVVFLQESQFNPATIAGCPAGLCELDGFQASAQAVARGPLQVPTFGGGTWKSEFAFQTGVPHSAFGPAGEFAPFNIAPGTHRSFARSLKAAGYRTIALYPTRGGMMNGRAAYAGYGFDEFYDASQLGLPGGYDTPDALVHAAAREVLARERLHEQPVFLFVLTIFNHAEHGIRMDRVPDALASEALRHLASAEEAQSVADYLWRTQAFLRERQLTRAAVLDGQRAAIFAWFGDHQPPFANAVSLRQRIRSLPTRTGTVPAKFQTWYEVNSNQAGRRLAQAPEAIDLVFLPGLLAQAAGVPLDDWLAANVFAREQCGGLLEACRTPGGREAYLTYLRQDLREFELP